jgi:hypothetical protein
MGIGGTAGIGATTGIPVRHVEAQRTPVSPADLRAAIGRAYTKVTGKATTPELLDTLTAQASLETGRGGSMYNYNFGGIKGHSSSGETADYMTHEVLGGQDVKIKQGFRAYASLDAGAEDYVKVLQKRFGGALDVAQTGNVDGFAHALKQAGYYTASESSYAAALRGLTGSVNSTTVPGGSSHSVDTGAVTSPDSVNALSAALATGASASLPTATELQHVFDALNVSAMRIAAPDSSDS